VFTRELLEPVAALRGAGPAIARRLARLGLYNAADLLLYAPRDWEDRSVRRQLRDWAAGPVNCAVRVIAHEWFGFGRMKTLKLIVQDDQASGAALACFNRPFMETSFPAGSKAWLYGRLDYKYGDLQSAAFELETLPSADPPTGDRQPAAAPTPFTVNPAPADQPMAVPEDKRGILPVYPLTDGLSQAILRKLTKAAIQRWGSVDDEVPAPLLAKRGLMAKAAALRGLHLPASLAERDQALHRLAYEELFYLQIMVLRRNLERRRTSLTRGSLNPSLVDGLRARLPFQPTSDQDAALAEIAADLASPWPMARLLQGDVGCGKTLVSFMAALYCIASGGQVAIMAPTELLARQHAETAAVLLEPLGVRLAFLSGNVGEPARRPLLRALASGDIDLVLGTHALFSDDVTYRHLRLVVVDEQHRFGVLQRLALGAKGQAPDVLMMSATPIPRSLALTAFGDLSISTIRAMPPGRKPILTHLAKQGNEAKVYDFVRQELQAGRQAYFVYPLVDRSDKLELKNAEAMFEELRDKTFTGFPGGLIHSRLPEEQKRSTMREFATGKLRFLVATSVVEVGVDVPNATCMVVEHAERFGLAALHQLRGRVGRGPQQSYCFLVWSEKLGEEGKQRVMAMKNTADGFVIAEEDLRIRGPGEITGTSQAGALRLSFADPAVDTALLEVARADAMELLAADPTLDGETGRLVRLVLERASPFSEKVGGAG